MMYKHEQGIPMKIGNNRPLHVSVLAGVVGVLLLAGCQRESEPTPVTDAAPAAEATAAVAVVTTAKAVPLVAAASTAIAAATFIETHNPIRLPGPSEPSPNRCAGRRTQGYARDGRTCETRA